MSNGLLLLGVHKKRTAAGGGGTVTFDAAGSAQRNISVTQQDYTGITVGSGSDRALVIFISFDVAVTGVTAVWDQGASNQSMTLISSKQENTWSRFIYAFGLVNPVSGNKTLRVSWTNTATVRSIAASFAGANQTGGVTTFPNATGADGNTATPAVSITTAANHMPIAGHISSNGAPSARSHTSVAEAAGGDPPCAVQYDAAASGTTNFTWTITSNTWGALGFGVAPT